MMRAKPQRLGQIFELENSYPRKSKNRSRESNSDIGAHPQKAKYRSCVT